MAVPQHVRERRDADAAGEGDREATDGRDQPGGVGRADAGPGAQVLPGRVGAVRARPVRVPRAPRGELPRPLRCVFPSPPLPL